MHLVFHKNVRGNWTLEKCLEEAKKYSTKREWRDKGRTSYQMACELGCVAECSAHMPKNNTKYSKEECILNAQFYKKIKNWRNSQHKFYNSARLNGWIEECTKHMEN